jgi:DNA-directed RNA polymerase beta' subunit
LADLLSHPLVDFKGTISNDPREVAAALGIEAARKFLIEEITRVLRFDGTYLNSRHVPLLVDAMVHRGRLTAVRRDGIDRQEVGPISKAAFEMTVDNFFQSATFSEHDDLEGFSARIMFGQVTKCGTGTVRAS